MLGSFVQMYSQWISLNKCALAHQTHRTARRLRPREVEHLTHTQLRNGAAGCSLSLILDLSSTGRENPVSVGCLRMCYCDNSQFLSQWQ